ncbi:RsbRD N-terminal domain-containing protein, partial [Streptomyces sp. NPDC056831]|uniref:RsbRD N-terminal domain-containing protein n=1 Tax=Streptomyces sp. NPDC056831 TaxID=3345954 RepID=UPI00369C809E
MIALDQHLTGHKEDITQQWLEVCTSNGSWLYSAKDQQKLEQKLKDQHELLVTIVAKSLRKEDVEDELNRWSLQCARDRAVHEVTVRRSGCAARSPAAIRPPVPAMCRSGRPGSR